jgi:hypothetical protein
MTGGTFVCDCGTRLRIFPEGKNITVVPCPGPGCKARHIVTGQVHEVQVDRNGMPYD